MFLPHLPFLPYVGSEGGESTLNSERLRAHQPNPPPLSATLRANDPVLDPGAAAVRDAVHAGIAPLGRLAHRVEEVGVLAARVPVGRVLDLDAGVRGGGVLN